MEIKYWEMRKDGTFEGVGDVGGSENGGRLWFFVTILKQKQSEIERENVTVCDGLH